MSDVSCWGDSWDDAWGGSWQYVQPSGPAGDEYSESIFISASISRTVDKTAAVSFTVSKSTTLTFSEAINAPLEEA